MWSDLVKVGLIGTDKCTPSVSTFEKLQAWGIVTEETTAAVLQGIGTLSLMRKGGFNLTKYDDFVEKPSEKESKSTFSPQSIQHLKEIINGKMEDVLPEFIYYTRLHDKIIPPEFLPNLFHYSRGNRQLWALIKPVIGKRGEWLLLQNPDWTHLLEWDDFVENQAPPQYSSAETMQLGQEILTMLKTTTIWAGDKEVLSKMKILAFQGDANSFANLDLLLNLESYHPLKNKVQEMFKTLQFRREMLYFFK